MDDRELTPTERRSARFLLGALAILTLVSLFIVWPFLTGTIFALVVGFLLQGPYRRLVRVLRWRALAATVLVLATILAIVVPVVMISWELVQDTRELVDLAGGGSYDAALVSAMTSLGMDEATARDVLAQIVTQLGDYAKANALGTLGALAMLGANIGIFIFLLFFVLVGHEKLMDLVRRGLPLEPSRSEHLLNTVGGRVRALFLGTFLVALLQGVAAGLGWWFFGFPSPVFWAFVMTILAVIPAIGPIIVLLPAGIYALTQGDVFAGVGIIIWGLAVVGLIDNFARPFIVGRSSDVHPAVVLLGTLGGLVVFGATGFIIGPLILSMVAPIFEEWEALRPRIS